MKKALIPYGEMSEIEQKAIDSAIKFTGSIINHVVIIEQSVERIIGYFFNFHKDGNENIKIFLNHFMFAKMDFSLKVAYLDQILKMNLTDYHKFDKINSLLIKFLELRNIVAHYPFVANPNELHYIKPDFDFKNIKESPNGRPKDWHYYFREIKIPDNKGAEIVEQLILLRKYLDLLELVFEDNIKVLAENPPIEQLKELLNEKAIKFLTKAERLGVYGINLKE